MFGEQKFSCAAEIPLHPSIGLQHFLELPCLIESFCRTQRMPCSHVQAGAMSHFSMKKLLRESKINESVSLCLSGSPIAQRSTKDNWL